MSTGGWKANADFTTSKRRHGPARCGPTIIASPMRLSDARIMDRPRVNTLGDVHDLRVLDLGCGHGMASVVLARHDASSPVAICRPAMSAKRGMRAMLPTALPRVSWFVDGERLPFADGVFDRIWGNAILHHLDLRVASRSFAECSRRAGSPSSASRGRAIAG